MALSLLENILKGDYEGGLGGPGGMVSDCEAIHLQAICWNLLMACKVLCKSNEIIVKYTIESYCISGVSTIALEVRNKVH